MTCGTLEAKTVTGEHGELLEQLDWWWKIRHSRWDFSPMQPFERRQWAWSWALFWCCHWFIDRWNFKWRLQLCSWHVRECNKCWDYKWVFGSSFQDIVDLFTDTEWSDMGVINGLRQYQYLACTEYGWFATTDSNNQPFGTRISENYFVELSLMSFERIANKLTWTLGELGQKSPTHFLPTVAWIQRERLTFKMTLDRQLKLERCHVSIKKPWLLLLLLGDVNSF